MLGENAAIGIEADEQVSRHLADELLAPEDRLALMRFMLLMRKVEERGVALYKQGKIPGSFYTGRGQEAIGVGATYALSGSDPVCSPLIRDLGAHLVRGVDLTELFRHYMGRENALSHGREGNVHFGDREAGIVGMVSMLPDMMLVACGIAMAFQMQGQRRCSLSFFGDGATSRGDWHEAMNWASLHRLPVVFVFENNQMAYSTPTEHQYRVSPVARCAGYGIPTETVEGNDVEAVFTATWRARERALRGEGPTVIACETMRMEGHGAHDDMRYVPRELLERWQARDPIALYAAALAKRGLQVDLETLQAELGAEVDAAVAAALQTPMPDPATALRGVFCEGAPTPIGTGPSRWSAHHSAG